MLERTRSKRERLGSSGPALGLFGRDDPGGTQVTVSHGPYAESLPVASMSVGEVRSRYRDRFDIDPHCQAFVDGQEVGDDVLLRSGQHLLFMRRAGEKGAARSRP
jgi:hypothetical protein